MKNAAVTMRIMVLAVAFGGMALANQARATPVTWFFYATGCTSNFPGGAFCTPSIFVRGVPELQYPQPILFGSFMTDGGAGSIHYEGLLVSSFSGDTDFVLDFVLFHIVGANLRQGVPYAFSPSSLIDFDIAWGDDGKPTRLIVDEGESNLLMRGDGVHVVLDIATDGDQPGCSEGERCLFEGFWSTNPNLASVPEPGSLALMASALISWLAYRRSRMTG